MLNIFILTFIICRMKIRVDNKVGVNNSLHCKTEFLLGLSRSGQELMSRPVQSRPSNLCKQVGLSQKIKKRMQQGGSELMIFHRAQSTQLKI
jgi:hypothetical protein